MVLAVGGRHPHLSRGDLAIDLGSNDELRILIEILQAVEAVLLLVRQRGPVVVSEEVVFLSSKPLEVRGFRRQFRLRSLSQDFLERPPVLPDLPLFSPIPCLAHTSPAAAPV